MLGRFLMLCECKMTEADTLHVSRKAIVKICKEARDIHRRPALSFEVKTVPRGYPKDWVALPLDIQKALYRIAELAKCDLDDPEVREEILEWTSRL